MIFNIKNEFFTYRNFNLFLLKKTHPFCRFIVAFNETHS